MRSTTRTGSAAEAAPHATKHARPATQTMYACVAVVFVIVFLAWVARFYHPDLGFTALIGFPPDHDRTAPALRAIPHYQYPAWASYDGQFYAQRAFDPLVRDPAIDRAMDSAPFRARRILFSWTAWAFGFGRPEWILDAFALQNVAAWLLLALLLTRWIAPVSARGLALWAACLFSHGMLWSVRFSLLDGPSLLLVACAVAAAERGRTLGSAAIAGAAGLARETNLLALAAQPRPGDRPSAIRLAAALVLAALPVLIWYDYLWSIYRSTLLTGAGSFVPPGVGLATAWGEVLAGVARNGPLSTDALWCCLLFALLAQAVYLLLHRDYASPWWRVAIGYAGLMTILNPELLDPDTGAVTRVLLAMTTGFNIQLTFQPRALRFWPWFVAGNLHLLAMPRAMS